MMAQGYGARAPQPYSGEKICKTRKTEKRQKGTIPPVPLSRKPFHFHFSVPAIIVPVLLNRWTSYAIDDVMYVMIPYPPPPPAPFVFTKDRKGRWRASMHCNIFCIIH